MTDSSNNAGKNSEQERIIEDFLRNAREQGDESLRLAADKLLWYMRKEYEEVTAPAHREPQSLSPEQERSRECGRAMRQLTDFLKQIKPQGRSAWPEVKQRVEHFMSDFPEFRKDLHYNAGLTYGTNDRSWSVFITGEASSENYDITLTSPEGTTEKIPL